MCFIKKLLQFSLLASLFAALFPGIVISKEIHIYYMSQDSKNMLMGMRHLSDSLSKKFPELRFTEGKLNNDKFSNFDSIKTCDVIMFNLRRKTIDQSQMDEIKFQMRSKKPVMGIRRASHAFNNWQEVDSEILGGAYNKNHGSTPTEFSLDEDQKGHQILKNVSPYISAAYVYPQNIGDGLADDAIVLLWGNSQGEEHIHPVAWVRNDVYGKRVFYTSLFGTDKHQEYADYKNENCHQLIGNAVYWVMEKTVGLGGTEMFTGDQRKIIDGIKINSGEFSTGQPMLRSLSGRK